MTRRDPEPDQNAPEPGSRRITRPSSPPPSSAAGPLPALSPWGSGSSSRGGSEGVSVAAPPVKPATDVYPVPATSGSSRRRWMTPRRVVLVAVVLVLAVVVVGGGLLWGRVSAFNSAVSSAPSTSSALWGPLGGKDRVNVLMIGYSGDPNHGGTYLADSLNVVSIDPAQGTTTLVPIPRDLWIQGLAEMPRGGKVNEAFADGWQAGGWKEGGALEVAVVSKVTGLPIDHFVSIDFAGFAAAVDALGGVTVYNPTAFKYTWNEKSYFNQHWSGSFRKGSLQLDGQHALDYARNRYTSVTKESSDFARSVRQERVLSALRDKIGSGIGSLGPGLAMMDALKGHLHTDLSAIDLFLLSGHMHVDHRLELKEGVALQAGRNSAGSYILFPVGANGLGDYAPLRKYIATQLARPIPSPKPTPSPSA